MPSFTLLTLSALLSLLSLSSAKKITLSLSLAHVAPAPLIATPWQRLSHHAAASVARAHHLKHLKPDISNTKMPLFPRYYGGYSISLSLGTPPQTLSFIMDTGSSLVWFPCTRRYTCRSCNSMNANAANISTFLPGSSSSSKILGCKNSKCAWIFPDVQCNYCGNNSSGCTELCPPYIVQYGSGSTSGVLMSETLILPRKSVENFVVGCSVFSSEQPAGIAGFGRGSTSLPAQMGLKRFSYCLVSHRFDDEPVGSDLVLGGDKGSAANYTPFRRNPNSSNPGFEDYYYVTLRKITVGGVNVRVSYNYLVANSDGQGGAIVDSGTTFTFLEKENRIFESVAKEFEIQAGNNFSRVAAIETQSGLRPCFNISGENSSALPKLSFHFKGGAKMDLLPLGDYFSFLDDSVLCMTIVTNDGADGELGPGPAIILGNYQQQNFYMEYDLEHERLGFQKRLCERV